MTIETKEKCMFTKKKRVFTGAATAMITPMKGGLIDYDALGELIDFQINGGVSAIVVCGTTGEGSTLTQDEVRRITRFSRERIGGRLPLIVGTGSNDTAKMIISSENAREDGADALLLVSPYYNRATPKGIIKSYLSVAEKTDLPMILYNVPSRTGVDIPVSAYRTLASHENIVAVKEASGNIAKIAELAAETDGMLDIYSGNDDQVIPVLSLGGVGVISVISNVMPKAVSDMCREYFSGRADAAKKAQLALMPMIRVLFSEVNPIPVKTALAVMGRCTEELRLPLCEMDEANKVALIKQLRKYKLI